MKPKGLNKKGLPLNPGAQLCAYYMRADECKFGTDCKCHHPEPEDKEAARIEDAKKRGVSASLPATAPSFGAQSAKDAAQRVAELKKNMAAQAARDIASKIGGGAPKVEEKKVEETKPAAGEKKEHAHSDGSKSWKPWACLMLLYVTPL